MNFREIFSQTWKDYKPNFKSIFKFMLIFFGIPAFIFSIINISMVLSNDNLRMLILNRVPEESFAYFPGSIFYFSILFIAAIVSALLLMFFYGGLTNISLKKKVFSFRDLLDSSKKSFWRYLAFSIVFFVFLFLLFLLLIIPGIIFFVYWVFGSYILFDQNKGILQSLKTSRKLVKRKWWKVLGYSLLFFLIMMAISIGISIIFFIPLLPFHIARGLASLFTQDPISPTFFVVQQITNVLAQIATDIIVIPLSILFYKNFYLSFKKSRKYRELR